MLDAPSLHLFRSPCHGVLQLMSHQEPEKDEFAEAAEHYITQPRTADISELLLTP